MERGRWGQHQPLGLDASGAQGTFVQKVPSGFYNESANPLPFPPAKRESIRPIASYLT